MWRREVYGGSLRLSCNRAWAVICCRMFVEYVMGVSGGGGYVLCVFVCPRLVVICAVMQYGTRAMLVTCFRLLSVGNTFACVHLCSCPFPCVVFICIFTVGERSPPSLRCGSRYVAVSIVRLVVGGLSRFCPRVPVSNIVSGFMSFGLGSLFGFVCGGNNLNFFRVWWDVCAAF